jgi:hypothetical protein
VTAPALSLAQKFALWKWLTDELKTVRADQLLPAAGAEMPSGARMPAMFGGKRAAWVTMPEPSQPSAFVKDEKALLAWARKNYPAKVEPTVTVNVDDDLIAFLADHYPSALEHGERVQPAWLGDILGALVKPGHYITATGEKLTEVPGIEVPEAAPPVPRVSLADAATEVIGEAWRSGDLDLGGLLALPAGDGGAE